MTSMERFEVKALSSKAKGQGCSATWSLIANHHNILTNISYNTVAFFHSYVFSSLQHFSLSAHTRHRSFLVY